MDTLIRGNLTRTVTAVFAIVVVGQALAAILRASCDGTHRHPLVTLGRTAAPRAADAADHVSLSLSMSLSDAWRDALDPCAPLDGAKSIAKVPGAKGKLFHWMKRRQRKTDAAANRDELLTAPEPPVPNNLQRNQSLRMGIRF